MTPEQLVTTVQTIRATIGPGKLAWDKLDALVRRVERKIDRSDPLDLPLSQTEVNHIVSVYAPLYQTTLHDIEVAGDALGTDAFS